LRRVTAGRKEEVFMRERILLFERVLASLSLTSGKGWSGRI
jgi:hypothetical protein